MNKVVLELAFCKCVIKTQEEIIKELRHELKTAELYGDMKNAILKSKGAKEDAGSFSTLSQVSRNVN